MAHADGAVVAFGDQVDEAVAVAGLDVKLWMPARHLGEYRREVGGTEGQRRSDAQAAAKLAGGQYRLFGNFYLGTHLAA